MCAGFAFSLLQGPRIRIRTGAGTTGADGTLMGTDRGATVVLTGFATA